MQHLLPVALGAGLVEVDEDLAQLVVDGERGIRRGVGAAGDAGLVLAEGDLVRDEGGGLKAGATRLLDVVGGGLRAPAWSRGRPRGRG